MTDRIGEKMGSQFRKKEANPNTQALGKDSLQEQVARSKSHDLVFAAVAHLGSGASEVTNQLHQQLEQKRYRTFKVKASRLILNVAKGLKMVHTGYPPDRVATTTGLQNLGDQLRARFGASFVAGMVIREIYELRKTVASEAVAFIIDSLKNPAEVEILRNVYGNSFYLISVICNPRTRLSRLRARFKVDDEARIEALAKRDEAGDSLFGQQVRNTLHEGDFFISNESSRTLTRLVLSDQLGRFVDIVRGTDLAGPTLDESGMYAAYNASLESSCLSRQVGAALLNEAGDILATGKNDVPKAGGGLYSGEYEGRDGRCFAKNRYCSNSRMKKEIYGNIFQELIEQKLIQENSNKNLVIEALKRTRIRNLIEFSRAIHAEMDAIVSLARTGRATTKDARLFCTTYPCHNCARHIVAAGIAEIVYIEPYPKSLAVELHDDAIRETTQSPEAPFSHVGFRLFSGVAPRRYRALFRMDRERKDDWGELLRNECVSKHRDPIFKKSYLDLEEEVALSVEDLQDE